MNPVSTSNFKNSSCNFEMNVTFEEKKSDLHFKYHCNNSNRLQYVFLKQIYSLIWEAP